MKKTELQLSETLYEQVEGLARQLRLSVPEVLCKAAEQMVRNHPRARKNVGRDWRFPDGHHLGPFRAGVEDWRLLGNETAA